MSQTEDLSPSGAPRDQQVPPLPPHAKLPHWPSEPTQHLEGAPGVLNAAAVYRVVRCASAHRGARMPVRGSTDLLQLRGHIEARLAWHTAFERLVVGTAVELFALTMESPLVGNVLRTAFN